MSDGLNGVVALFEKKGAVPFKAVGERFVKVSWGKILVKHVHHYIDPVTQSKESSIETVYSNTVEISKDPHSSVVSVAELRNVPDYETMTYKIEYMWHEPIDVKLKSLEQVLLENCSFFKEGVNEDV